jgi:hypothetical protein
MDLPKIIKEYMPATSLDCNQVEIRLWTDGLHLNYWNNPNKYGTNWSRNHVGKVLAPIYDPGMMGFNCTYEKVDSEWQLVKK